MHVIIAGAARAGKTTLSLILKDCGFIHYKMDSIKRGICDAYNLKYDEWESLSPIMCKIIDRMIKDNKSDITYLQESYLFDIPFLYPKDLELIDIEDTIVIFLGYADLTWQENFANIRKYDAPNLWTNKASDNVLEGWCKENVAFSKYLKRECERLSIPYFDTSHNRDTVIENVVKYILERKDEYERSSK